MKKILLAIISIVFFSGHCWAIENLDEMMARMSRQATATWGYQYLEDPGNYYIWQPETLMYQDDLTGHEVWVLARQPQGQDIISKEHGTNAWSYDGSKIGFFDYSTRDTGNPLLTEGNERASRRFVVNTDGSKLRAIEGYGKYTIPFEGFGWAHTDNAYYAFGSHEVLDGPLYSLYKVNVDDNNRTSGTLVLDTSSVNTYAKELIKDGVSSDDSWLVGRDVLTHDAGPCNQRTTREMYFFHLDGSPQVDSHWGIARGIGPAGDPYSDHIPEAEERFHDVWSPGPDPQWIMGDFSGISSLFVTMNRTGSCQDGGPLWADWDGDSFGPNNEIRVVSNGTAGEPSNPYGLPYFGHPVFDRWGRYCLMGTYTDYPRPGTRILDTTSWSFLPNYVLADGQYDGQHHSWTGWSDYVIGVNPVDITLYANKWDQESSSAIQIVDTHFPGYGGNYNGYPRPSQSPDGTKVVFAALWLNSTDDKYPYLSWAVVHYPHPPKITGAEKADTAVRISWGWDGDNLYTNRGWPNEATDPPPLPREIKGYHVWSSPDQGNWTELTTNAIPFGTDFYDASQEPGTTRYYAVTSEEYSGLESRILSNIWQVSLDAGGAISQSSQVTAYPDEPGGISPFWQQKPSAPLLTSVTPQAVSGHFLLKWQEPDDPKIRYYNIYYSTSVSLTADMLNEKTRIASVPRGTSQWLDWNAESSATAASYRITSVDRQGNEGVLPRPR